MLNPGDHSKRLSSQRLKAQRAIPLLGAKGSFRIKSRAAVYTHTHRSPRQKTKNHKLILEGNNPMNLRITTANETDAQAMAQVRVAAWQAGYGAFMPKDFLQGLNAQQDAQGLQNFLAQPPAGFCALKAIDEHNNFNLCAYAWLGEPRFSSAEPCMELWALNCHPKYWRCGIGRALLVAVIQRARAQTGALALWCIQGNTPAEALYNSMGFTRTGHTRTNVQLTGHPFTESAWWQKC
jgi:GNAT superfamily N-acetyltransferase